MGNLVERHNAAIAAPNCMLHQKLRATWSAVNANTVSAILAYVYSTVNQTDNLRHSVSELFRKR